MSPFFPFFVFPFHPPPQMSAFTIKPMTWATPEILSGMSQPTSSHPYIQLEEKTPQISLPLDVPSELCCVNTANKYFHLRNRDHLKANKIKDSE